MLIEASLIQFSGKLKKDDDKKGNLIKSFYCGAFS
jgi:hypothetical protein